MTPIKNCRNSLETLNNLIVHKNKIIGRIDTRISILWSTRSEYFHSKQGGRGCPATSERCPASIIKNDYYDNLIDECSVEIEQLNNKREKIEKSLEVLCKTRSQLNDLLYKNLYKKFK